jgi:hypothetical protein
MGPIISLAARPKRPRIGRTRQGPACLRDRGCLLPATSSRPVELPIDNVVLSLARSAHGSQA